VLPIDEPATSMRSGSEPALSRSNRANDSELVLDIAGLPLLLHAADDAHGATIHAAFGTSGASGRPPEAELRYGPGRMTMPDREPDAHQPDLDVWNDGDVLSLSSEAHGIRARVTPTLIDAVSTEVPHERALRRIFQPVITHVLAHRGVFVLHAASMRRGNQGLLALGDTGQGKSTIALAAFQDDWRVMGDDLVALWLADDAPMNGTPMIRGLPKPMALPSDVAVDGTPALRDAEMLDWDHRRRLHIPVEQLELRPVRLGAIVVVQHGAGPRSTSEAMTADRVASRLMSSYTSVGDAPLMRDFFPVAMRAARVPSNVLSHGTDRETRVGDAQRILSKIAAGW
jgi:hypothetical protein